LSREIFISESLKFWILFSIQKVRLDHEKARKKNFELKSFSYKKLCRFQFYKNVTKVYVTKVCVTKSVTKVIVPKFVFEFLYNNLSSYVMDLDYLQGDPDEYTMKYKFNISAYEKVFHMQLFESCWSPETDFIKIFSWFLNKSVYWSEILKFFLKKFLKNNSAIL